MICISNKGHLICCLKYVCNLKCSFPHETPFFNENIK